MAIGDETNVDKGKADDLELSLEDATDVVTDTNLTVSAFIEARRMVVRAMVSCDKNTMTACEYLDCLMASERKYTANEIEGTVGGAIGAKIVADGCRDLCNWDKVFNCSAICMIPGLVASGLEIAATTLEVKDDSQSAERLDAIGLCFYETGDRVQQVKTSLQNVKGLLLTAPGRREGYPAKP